MRTRSGWGIKEEEKQTAAWRERAVGDFVDLHSRLSSIYGASQQRSCSALKMAPISGD